MYPIRKGWPNKLATSDLDDKKDRNAKEKGQNEQPKASTMLAIITSPQTPELSKPCITEYFDNMTNNSPIRFTPRDRRRCQIIVTQQELNDTV